MKIKYSPVLYNPYSPACSGLPPETQILYIDENTISVDGEIYSFDISVSWPSVSQDTNGVILEAHRESGELFVTVRRFYTGSCGAWDTGAYGDFNAGP
jgi:hypothetical protein